MNNTIRALDKFLSEKYIHSFKGKAYVQSLIFHKIFTSRSEISFENGDPLEAIDMSQFEKIISFFHKRGLRFIDETDILSDQLEKGQSYIYLTFDDGYFNNFNCLEILEKYNAKATFMISTNHIRENRAFWWDVTSREIWKQNREKSEFFIEKKVKEVNSILYNKKWMDQEIYLKHRFNLDSLTPQNDIYRPMSETELKEFATHPLVRIGNHTDNHINLTLYNKSEIIDSIQSTERYLNSLISQKISSISYPHGFINDEVLETINQLGYKIGLTVNSGQHSTMRIQNKEDLIMLNRTEVSGKYSIELQLRKIHTNFSLFEKMRDKISNF
jgi:peptidoglycan/xylan/chitin deacetylase (PgdA/CDA1 family)